MNFWKSLRGVSDCTNCRINSGSESARSFARRCLLWDALRRSADDCRERWVSLAAAHALALGLRDIYNGKKRGTNGRDEK